MSIRRFFIASLALAIVAVGLHLTSLSQTSRDSRTIARAVTLSESERVAARVDAQVYFNRGGVIGCIGLVIALASLVFVVVSARKREPAWRSVTFALLFIYVMLQFAFV